MTDKILLVEDNPDDVLLTIRAFKKQKIQNEIVVAKDGVEALDLLLGRNVEKINPAVVLLDLKLPKLNGLDVLKELKKYDEFLTLPIVVLTTSDEEDDMIESYVLGANSYIRKPIRFDKFSEIVGQLGVYWLLVNQKAGV